MVLLRNIMLGLLLFSVIMTSLIFAFNDVTNTYDVTLDDNFSDSYDQINKTLEENQVMIESVYNSSASEQSSFFQKSSGTLKAIGIMTFSGLTFMTTIMEQLAIYFRVPPWFVAAGSAALFILITWAIATALGFGNR